MKLSLEKIVTLIVFIAQVLVCAELGANGQSATFSGGQEPKQFDMMLRFDGSSSYNDNNTVVRAGQVLPNWSSRCWKSKDAGCATRSFSEYTEQLFFQFSYDSVKNFNFRYPTIKASGGRAKAEIVNYSHDLDERNGEIIITHNCEPSKNNFVESSVVELMFPLTSKNILEIGWTKQCGYGEHEMLDYGVVSRRGDVKNEDISLKGVSKDDQVPVFGPAVLSTRVYLKHQKDEYSQRFSSPVVQVLGLQRGKGQRSRNKGLTVNAKGSGFGDMVLGKTSSVFDVFYNCHEHGIWKVEAMVKVVPFNALKMKWMKDCGGGAEGHINIGTRAEDGVADVVSEGITLERFGSRAKGNEKGSVSGKGSGTKAFFLWTSEWKRSVGSISIGEITAHSNNDRIGRAKIAGLNKIYERAHWGIAGIGEHGETIEGAVKRVIGVKVECKRKGRMRVGVRLSVHDRDGIEWWFYNDCEKDEGRKKGVYVTAGTLTYIIMMSLLCVMMIASVGMRTRGGQNKPKL